MWKRAINKIKRYRKPNWTHIQEQVPIEREWLIYFEGQKIYSGFITPRQQVEWAYGYLLSHHDISFFETQISHTKQGNEIHLSTQTFDQAIAKSDPFTASLAATDILDYMSAFQDESILFKDTAIVESIAFFNQSGIQHFADDIYPLHSWYKLLGSAYIAQSDPRQFILILYGKLNKPFLEVLNRFNISFIISRTGLTDQSYDFMIENEITVLGFTRGSQFTLYNNPKQLIKTVK